MPPSFYKKFISLPRSFKRLIMLLFDVTSMIVVLLISFSFRLGEFFWPQGDVVWLVLMAPVIAIPIFVRMGLYRAIVRYIEFKALWTIVRAVSLYAVIWGAAVYISGQSGVPRSVILINWVVAILVVGGGRIVARGWLAGASNDSWRGHKKNAIVYGAGEAGAQLVQALSHSRELRPIAFIDDSSVLQGHEINGLKVYPFSGLSRLMEKKHVAEVLLAIPSVSRERRNEILTLLEPYSVQVRTLPSVEDVAYGRVTMDVLREVTIEDLLGRDSVSPDETLLRTNIEGKVVMVTGAGGSIGSELCRQISRLNPRRLVLFEQSEPALYAINKELSVAAKHAGDYLSELMVAPVLGSVTDAKRVGKVCAHFNVQTIYHAAAYKHVPLVEMNNTEGVKNNLFGTLCCAQAAITAGVEDFVLISTDKAVRPTNTMGATKRCAEMVLQALAEKQRAENKITKFVMVRFGNVLGSSGSVVPLFQQQIKQGGPVTVTDPKIIRYFMTIPEAAQLVIQAGALGDGGNVLVLDMGEPVRIIDLAKKMIRLSGLVVSDGEKFDGDIEIEFTGLRPGEKLYEELLIGDGAVPTEHPMISRAEEEMLSWEELRVVLSEIKEATEQDNHERLRELLMQVVPGFRPQCEICDVTYTVC